MNISDYCEKKNLSLAAFAKEINVPYAVVYRLATKEKTKEVLNLLELEKLTEGGISAAACVFGQEYVEANQLLKNCTKVEPPKPFQISEGFMNSSQKSEEPVRQPDFSSGLV